MISRSLLRRLYPFISVSFLCLIVIGAAIRPVRKPNSQLAGRRSEDLASIVENQVPKLEITRLERKGDSVIEVILRNHYHKDITAVAALTGAYKSQRRDYSGAELERDQKLAPESTDRFLYSIDSSAPRITICAVIFADGTSEGNPDEIKGILDQRLGIKTQLLRIKPDFQRLSKITSSDLPAELTRVKWIADALPIEPDSHIEMSDDLEYGLKLGRNYIKRYIADIEAVVALAQAPDKAGGHGQKLIMTESAYATFRKKFETTSKYFLGYERRL